MSDKLPKLFFDHFTNTSFVVEKGDKTINDFSVNIDYDGSNQDRVLFMIELV
jgi:hypothetical protein